MEPGAIHGRTLEECGEGFIVGHVALRPRLTPQGPGFGGKVRMKRKGYERVCSSASTNEDVKRSLRTVGYIGLTLAMFVIGGCSEDTPTDLPPLECAHHLGSPPTCAGSVATFCSPANVYEEVDCSVTGQVCVDGSGCQRCEPDALSCRGGNVVRCGSDGSSFITEEVCDVTDGLICDPATATCRDFCDTTTLGNSYVGCEYYAASTANVLLHAEHEFAIVVANQERGGSVARHSRLVTGSSAACPL